MLSEKFDGVLSKTIIEAKKALDFAKGEGAIMSLSASWHRVAEGDKRKENVDMGEFTFLLVNEGKPTQIDISFEKEKFSKTVIDLSKDLGDMSDEEQFAKQVKFLTDQEILNKIEKDGRVQKALTKAKHLRVYSMNFVIYDDKYEAPIWTVVLKNWPLTNYWKREIPVTVEAIVEGTRGKIISLAVHVAQK